MAGDLLGGLYAKGAAPHMSVDHIIFITHALAGAAFGVMVLVMQTVINPAMAKIPAGEPKNQAGAIVVGRARLAVDILIVGQTITAFYLLATRWSLIGGHPWLMAKVALGGTALALANLLHFYWRGKKMRLKAAGKTEEFAALAAFTMRLEKIVLIAVPGAWIMGVIWSHF